MKTLKHKILGAVGKFFAWTAAAITLISVSLYLFSDQIPAALDKHFYRSGLWSGSWSSNTEYTIAPGLSDHLPADSPKVIVRMKADPERGTIHGDIISEGLCESNPITWIFYFDSKKPNYLSFGKTRDFEISYLRGGTKVPMATVRAEIQKPTDGTDVLILKTLTSSTGAVLPERFGVAKDLNAFDDDLEYLNDKCADVTAEFYKELAGRLKRG